MECTGPAQRLSEQLSSDGGGPGRPRLRDGRRADDDEVVPRARQRDVQPLWVGGERAGARHRQRQHDRRLLHALRRRRIIY